MTDPSPCCPPPEHRPTAGDGRHRFASASVVSAVIAAIAASACCWLPLLLVAVGASVGGVAAAFERARPLALMVAGALWLAGFIAVYRPRRRCGPDEVCATSAAPRFARIAIWLSLALIVAFATIPQWLPTLRRHGDPPAAAASQQAVPIGRVDGLTCAACTTDIETALQRLPGVVSAHIEFPTGDATVVIDATRQPGPQALQQAVERLGYRLVPAGAATSTR